MYCVYFDITRKRNYSAIVTPTVVGGRRPFRLKFALKVTHPPSKNADFDRFPLTSHPQETAKKFNYDNKKSTTGFATSYRWSTYVTPKSPKGWLKAIFVAFLNKIQLQSNKVCYKVSLCLNFSGNL